VLAITPLDGAPLQRFMSEIKLPFPVLADPQRQVYRAYGLERGLALGPGSVIKFLRLLWREGRFYRPLSDPLQTGGDFVIDGKGQIRFASTSADPTDRPQARTLFHMLLDLRV